MLSLGTNVGLKSLDETLYSLVNDSIDVVDAGGRESGSEYIRL
jgi:hypothetical protein